MIPEPAAQFIAQLEAVRPRLDRLVHTRLRGYTDPDPTTGEKWEAGQVWAHLTEFIPYWITQAEMVVAARSPKPVRFGRTKTDPGRIAAIESGRARAVAEQWQTLQEDLNDLRAFLLEIPGDAWRRSGEHPTLGVMSMERIVDEFLVAHIEEHATQLESLSAE